MITTYFMLLNYEYWEVKLFVAVDRYYADEILDYLETIDCPLPKLREAEKNLRSGLLNTGLTYSNYQMHRTVMVIALTSSGAEFDNSLRHEEEHLQKDICLALGIDPYSEDAAYCSGEIARAIFPFVRPMFCDHCREQIKASVREGDYRGFIEH